MDQKALVEFSLEKNNKKFYFSMPQGTTIGEAYDAAWSFLNEVYQLGNKAVEQAKPDEMTQEAFEESIKKAETKEVK